MYIRADNMCQYGGGQVVSMLDFYSDDPSSNPLKPTVFSVKFVLEKTENKQKEAMVCPFFLKKTRAMWKHFPERKASSVPAGTNCVLRLDEERSFFCAKLRRRFLSIYLSI